MSTAVVEVDPGVGGPGVLVRELIARVRLQRWSLCSMLFLGVAACRAPAAESPCETTAQCLESEVCIDGTCREACNNNSDCAAQRVCVRGACLPEPADAQRSDAGRGDLAPGDASGDDRLPRDIAPHDDATARDLATPDRPPPDQRVTDQPAADQQATDQTTADQPRTDRPTADRQATDRPPSDLDCPGVLCDTVCIAGGECCRDGDCSDELNPFCVGHLCTPCNTCTCPHGMHDGGDGDCVPAGSCSPGYGLAYPDADLDGVGVEPASESCYALPLPAGVAEVSGDCDDGDPAAFIETTAFPDHDGDGYTGPAEVLCVGVSLPTGYLDRPAPPPWVSFEAGSAYQASTSGDSWTGQASALYPDGAAAQCEMDRSGPCRPLVVEALDLRVPEQATVRGVAVHVLRRAAYDECNQIVDALAQLATAGTPMGESRAQTEIAWSQDWEEVVYGGPTDVWGLELTPGEVTDPTFGFAYSGRCADGGDNDELWVDHVWVEVFTDQGADCDEGDDQVWSERDGYTDQDQDQYTVGELQQLCMGAALLAGHSQRSAGADCYDRSAASHPGATAFHSTDRGDGSYDYNCDNVLTKESITEDTGCECLVDMCYTISTNNITPPAACGGQNDIDRCLASCNPCELTTVSRTTRCR